MPSNILVFGAGSWGSALAIQLAHVGHQVYLHSWKAAHNQNMIKSKSNEAYLPGIPFPDNLEAIIKWQTVIDQCQDILIATPSCGFYQTLIDIKPFIKEQGIISATKGFCHQSHKRLDQLSEEVLPNTTFGMITGPSFAKEVAKQLPTAILAVSSHQSNAKHIQQLFNSETFPCYSAYDVIGAEIGGAVKNILAIACGIADGLQYGANARAGLITRGLKEMIRLGIALGGEAETFNGLSGLGDLVLTCTDNQSRNRRFGVLLGKGYTQQEAIKEIEQFVEGITTTKIVFELAQSVNIDMPIVSTVYHILYQNHSIQEAVTSLLNRGLKAEK